MGLIVVTDCLRIALEVLEDCSSVEEQVRVWILHLTFGLCVSSQRQIQLLDIRIVCEKVSEVGISKNIPGLRVAHILTNSLAGKTDALNEVCFFLISVSSGNLTQYH